MCQVESEVLAFVADFTATPVEEIRLNTLINGELGVDGDDGAEFLQNFSKKFEVDLYLFS